MWWHWMSGNVSAEGAQLDLEWMKRVGVGGVHAFSGGGRLEKTYVSEPLPFMSPKWRDAYRGAIRTARAHGMDVTIAASPGWSQTGGPWVQPVDGMKKYVWSELEIDGGSPVGKLPHPPVTVGAFQARARTQGFGPILDFPATYGEAAVFAFPTPAAEMQARPSFRGNGIPLPALDKAESDLSAAIPLPLPIDGSKPYIDIDFGQPQMVQAVSVAIDALPAFDVMASSDGKAFSVIARFEKEHVEHPSPQHSFALPPTRARLFRIRFDRPTLPTLLPGRPAPATPPALPTEIVLHRLSLIAGGRLNRFEAKAGFQASTTADRSAKWALVPGSTIDPDSVIDLTGRMQPDGTLDWTPPKGRWTVVRLGWSLTGQVNNPAELSATGLEVDKLDKVAVRGYINKLFSLYRDDIGLPLGSAGIGSLLTDSWEAGPQNWTPALLDEFASRRKYQASRWLPVLTGRIVGTTESSDAFLFDFRQTLKDLITDNHYGVLAKAAHEQGMTYYTEAQGDAPRSISDGLTVKAIADIPTAEFWYRPFSTDPGQPPLIADLAEATSVANLYGKPLVAAEAMTVAAGYDPWSFSPAMLKPVADEIFARGANRMLIHDSHHQPWTDRAPGLALGFFGQYFNRNDTWAEQAKVWTDYLAATSFLLQQGKPVADILYFYGEEENLTQRFEHSFDRAVPNGYAFDYIDAASVKSIMSVKDGKIVSDAGMAYRLIYLPAFVDRMTLPVLRKLDDLVRQGATLVGRAPVGGLGIGDDPAEIRMIVERLWGAGASPSRRPVGKGKVYPTSDLGSALRGERIMPDIEAPANVDLLTRHRRTAGEDIYFLSNRSDKPIDATLRFRAVGEPQLWTADDGRIQPLSFVRRNDGTDVKIAVAGREAAFIIFRPSPRRRLSVTVPKMLDAQTVSGPWAISFQPGRGAPETASFPTLVDWSENEDPRIRYFSGAATYSQSITIEPSMLSPGRRLWLDLGAVHELAAVSIDGRDVGTAWKAPYRIDLTGKIGVGEHRLEIKTVNLWVNRLIGDRQPGVQPIAFAPQSPYRQDSPLRRSGLIGPVRLVSESDPENSLKSLRKRIGSVQSNSP